MAYVDANFSDASPVTTSQGTAAPTYFLFGSQAGFGDFGQDLSTPVTASAATGSNVGEAAKAGNGLLVVGLLALAAFAIYRLG